MKSNDTLLIIRQNLIKIYKQYEYIIMPFLKFIIIFSVITMISTSFGYIGIFNKVEVVLFLALLGTFLPEKWMILGFILLMPVYIAMANIVLGVIAFLFLGVLYLLFMRLFPKESLLIIATIVCFNMGMEALLPVLAGLFGSYVCIIAIIIGTFIWFVMPQFAQVVQPNLTGKDEILGVLTSLTSGGLKNIIGDKTMLCTIVVFFIVFSIVYIIRKQSIDYAAYLAIGIGIMMHLAGFILAKLFLNINISMSKILITTILVTVIAIITQFFSKVLDYQRAEVVSFEDEENYYYVKVVPKIHINTNHKKVKRIYNTKADYNAKTDYNTQADNKDYINSFSISQVMTDEEMHRNRR